jgi:hypothetical protein
LECENIPKYYSVSDFGTWYTWITPSNECLFNSYIYFSFECIASCSLSNMFVYTQHLFLFITPV